MGIGARFAFGCNITPGTTWVFYAFFVLSNINFIMELAKIVVST